MKPTLGTTDYFAIVVGACAVVMFGLTIRDRYWPVESAGAEYVDDWQRFAIGTTYGSAAGPVTVVQFSDYQCPACKRFNESLDIILGQHQGQLQVVYRHLPVRATHPFAESAAIASECAGHQGRFREFHNLLYERQDSIPIADWAAWATAVGVPDVESFAECVLDSSGQLRRRISADSAAALELGARGTPTILINGRLLHGTPSEDRLRAIIDSVQETAAGRRAREREE